MSMCIDQIEELKTLVSQLKVFFSSFAQRTDFLMKFTCVMSQMMIISWVLNIWLEFTSSSKQLQKQLNCISVS